jgi:hypothetical protein
MHWLHCYQPLSLHPQDGRFQQEIEIAPQWQAIYSHKHQKEQYILPVPKSQLWGAERMHPGQEDVVTLVWAGLTAASSEVLKGRGLSLGQEAQLQKKPIADKVT